MAEDCQDAQKIYYSINMFPLLQGTLASQKLIHKSLKRCKHYIKYMVSISFIYVARNFLH